MTTRIHVVNFGPDVIEVSTGALYNHPAAKVYPQDSANLYVFDGQEVNVRELKPEAPKS